MLSARPGNIQRIFAFMGAALLLYGVSEWYQLKKPTDEEIMLTVEIRYLSEVARLQKSPHNSTGEPIALPEDWQIKYRQAIRNEVIAPYENKRKRAASLMFAGGALLFVMASGYFSTWLGNRLSRAPSPPK